MDFRDIFEGLDKMAREMESMFGDTIMIIDGQENFNRQNLKPREMMLKNPRIIGKDVHEPRSLIEAPLHYSNQFPGGLGFSGTFSSTSEHQTITKNSDGTERIISKTYRDGQTIEREVVKKGGQIISEREIVSGGNYPMDQKPLPDGGIHDGGDRKGWYRFW